MGNRNLYLSEVVDVVGQGQYAYMEHLWTDPVLHMPEMFGLQGSFSVCAAGGDRQIMTPLPRTVYGPDDWEDASLDDWLES